MSRIGNMPITIPAGLEVKQDGQTITVKGKDATLSLNVHPSIIVEVKDNVITVKRPNDEKQVKALHGLTRSLINNMIIGCSEGFKKELEIQGVGYKAAKQGKKVVFNLGYSHPIEMEEPAGITIDVPAQNQIIVKGADKQLVGETAAKIRSFRLPDAYKGKGIRYVGEYVRIKEGKTGAKK
ncbi:MAG TPA: 50S ribosomal protein L6 [Clostridiales bacterium]|nr:50S ribosomal protein L6 [Saccharofermentanaceae bacterium]HBY32558.1 50S ribosomal protein L6 [Clostridiales bacterium]